MMPSTIAVYEDKVLNIIWEDEPIAILIINEKVTKSYKSYFENKKNLNFVYTILHSIPAYQKILIKT